MASIQNPFRRNGARSAVTTASARIPVGWRVFAFGDVHGRADLLRRLIDTIERDLASDPVSGDIVIGLGDYIDRGPDSYSVLDTLLDLRQHHETAFLMGNHESLLLDFVAAPAQAGRGWLSNGGWETLVSYGVECSPNASSEEDLTAIRDDLLDQMPPEHVDLLNSLTLSAEVGDYHFVHAGARPGIPLSEQRERDALWIRDGFADRDARFERIVVHGHTPVERPFVGTYRINLDTGAYATGKLSCVVLEGSQRRIMEVTG